MSEFSEHKRERIAEARQAYDRIKRNRSMSALILMLAAFIYGFTIAVLIFTPAALWVKITLAAVVWVGSAVWNFFAICNCEESTCGSYTAVLFGPVTTLAELHYKMIRGTSPTYDMDGDQQMIISLLPDGNEAVRTWYEAGLESDDQPAEPEA